MHSVFQYAPPYGVESAAFQDNYLLKKLTLDLDNTQGNFEMRCIGINEWA